MLKNLGQSTTEILDRAATEARNLNHEYIGTEHLLLALLWHPEGAALLNALKLSPAALHDKIFSLTKPGPDTVTLGKVPFTPRARKALAFATEEADLANQSPLTPDFLLLGLLREHDGIAAQVLLTLGLTLAAARNHIVMPAPIPPSDPLHILLVHDRWATRQLLETCTTLTHDQFHQPFEMGPGSLHNTTTHILGAIYVWAHSLAGQTLARRLEEDPPHTPTELLALLDTVYNALDFEAHRLPLDTLLHHRTRAGHIITLPRGATLVHVATHSMHHRAQCLNMLRHLGISPLPPSSVVQWTQLPENLP